MDGQGEYGFIEWRIGNNLKNRRNALADLECGTLQPREIVIASRSLKTKAGGIEPNLSRTENIHLEAWPVPQGGAAS